MACLGLLNFSDHDESNEHKYIIFSKFYHTGGNLLPIDEGFFREATRIPWCRIIRNA